MHIMFRLAKCFSMHVFTAKTQTGRIILVTVRITLKPGMSIRLI